MIILDSTIWIEFLKKHEPYFSVISDLLEKKEILAVECVFGELLQRVKKDNEQKIILGYWEHLDKLEDTYEIIIEAGIYSNELPQGKPCGISPFPVLKIGFGNRKGAVVG